MHLSQDWKFPNSDTNDTFGWDQTWTEDCYDGPDELWVEMVVAQWFLSDDLGCFFVIDPKVTLE